MIHLLPSKRIIGFTLISFSFKIISPSVNFVHIIYVQPVPLYLIFLLQFSVFVLYAHHSNIIIKHSIREDVVHATDNSALLLW